MEKIQVRAKAVEPLEEATRRRVDLLFAAANRLGSLSLPPVTSEEIEREIQAARRRTSGRL